MTYSCAEPNRRPSLKVDAFGRGERRFFPGEPWPASSLTPAGASAMSAVCSRCSNLYDPANPCPHCGTGAPITDSGTSAMPGPRWQQTSWGRVLIGLILAQGLFYGLRHLLTGILLASSPEGQDIWEDMTNLLFLQAIQLLALLAGGILAGGGQHQGLFLGTMVGALNGILAIVLRQNPGQELTMVGLYGQPLLHAAFGAFGGWIGGTIWKPIQPVLLVSAPQRKAPPRRKVSPFAGRVYWFRVVTGAAFAIAGTLSATLIFQKVLDASRGALGTTDELQDRLITWEIKALAMLVGGVLAGATTSNGLKQGLFVGLVSSVILSGILAPKTDAWLEVAGLTVISAFSLGMVGGWFGGQLFPPIIKRDPRLGRSAWI
jgi:hypothetical protein